MLQQTMLTKVALHSQPHSKLVRIKSLQPQLFLRVLPPALGRRRHTSTQGLSELCDDLRGAAKALGGHAFQHRHHSLSSQGPQDLALAKNANRSLQQLHPRGLPLLVISRQATRTCHSQTSKKAAQEHIPLLLTLDGARHFRGGHHVLLYQRQGHVRQGGKHLGQAGCKPLACGLGGGGEASDEAFDGVLDVGRQAGRGGGWVVSAILRGRVGGGGVVAACYQGLDELVRRLDALARVGRDQLPVALERHMATVLCVGGRGGWEVSLYGGEFWVDQKGAMGNKGCEGASFGVVGV